MIRPAADEALERIVRGEAGRIAAALTRRTGDFDVAEEALQDAIVRALGAWRRDGVPPNPEAWLALAARRAAIDRLRRRATGARAAKALAALASTAGDGPTAEDDERIPLLFACCHPALAAEARVALTLRAVVGLTTGQIARAFLVPEATLAQRIVRAKRKIVQAAIPMAAVPRHELASRLDDVLSVIALTYNAGYLTPSSAHDVAADALWLADLVAAALPGEPEALGLLALLLLLDARAPARHDPRGILVPLADQDRRRWDRARIRRAQVLLELAAAQGRTGRFQLQAALAACHAEAPSHAATDWFQVLTLYDVLLTYDPSPVVRLNRAVALAEIDGPEEALRQVESLIEPLANYHLLHATRAHLLERLGRPDAARDATRRALELAATPAEEKLLRLRLDGY